MRLKILFIHQWSCICSSLFLQRHAGHKPNRQTLVPSAGAPQIRVPRNVRNPLVETWFPCFFFQWFIMMFSNHGHGHVSFFLKPNFQIHRTPIFILEAKGLATHLLWCATRARWRCSVLHGVCEVERFVLRPVVKVAFERRPERVASSDLSIEMSLPACCFAFFGYSSGKWYPCHVNNL